MTATLPAAPPDDVEAADETLKRLVPADLRVKLAARLANLEQRGGSQHVELHLQVRDGEPQEGDVRPKAPDWVKPNGGGR